MNGLPARPGNWRWRLLAAGSLLCLIQCVLTALVLASIPVAALSVRAHGTLEQVLLRTALTLHALELPLLAALWLFALPLALGALRRRADPWPAALAFAALPLAAAGWTAGGPWHRLASPLAALLLAGALHAGRRCAVAGAAACGRGER